MLLIAACFSDCSNPVADNGTGPSAVAPAARPARYAKRFSIEAGKGCKIVKLFGEKNSRRETATFVLYPKSGQKPEIGAGVYYVATPVARVACMSPIYATMLSRLGSESSIMAIDNVDYYVNPYIVEGVKNGKITELSKGPEMNAEQTLVLKPDLVLTFGMGDPRADVNPKITGAGIPVAVSLDHLEETPLARAEWIRFFAAFFDKEAQADSLFAATEQRYLTLEKMTDTLKHRPTVLTELKYGDAWYVPGGNSYMAHLLGDAGADYIWKGAARAGSIPLPFETVYTKAGHCDYWLNLFTVNSRQELLNYDPRYALFSAYKKGNLYNNNRHQNSKGYSDYWETGICSPDALLADLIFIFHPALLPQHQLQYYKKLE